ncbi:MAG TPA: chromosome partitioning protein ParB [Syntrophobacteraceae bacterium]|nr:chromosome partitioning protein ParB [Syntrophobacteraceae bacterium]HBZ56419.1 chromosome partitioning protein ParB [Syntrophobacteraceae bacterium]
MSEKKRGLGRGLQELLATSDWLRRDDIQLFYCPVENLVPNPYQPRQKIQDQGFQELVESVTQKGVLQPILATKTDMPEQYQILAGERRWQAAKAAGLAEVPVLLRESTPAEALELALIENIQRRDLNCIEEAMAYRRLHEEFHLTQQELAERVGKDRSTIANLLRLLQLPADIQSDVVNERITMGHARALLSVNDPQTQRHAREIIIERQLSVRETEKLLSRKAKPAKTGGEPVADAHYRHLEESIQARLGTRVTLRRSGQRGSITITFLSDDDLQRLLELLGVAEPNAG